MRPGTSSRVSGVDGSSDPFDVALPVLDLDDEPDDPFADLDEALPLPRRHSETDPSAGLVDRLLDFTGLSFGTAAVGAVAAGMVLGAVLWLLRAPPIPIEDALPLVDPASLVTTTAAPGPVVVHVAGAVRAPGLYTLRDGARIGDAIDAAGGVLAEADVDRVNLAATAVDGSQIFVPRIGEPSPAGVDSPTGAGTGGGGPIDLNTATASQLEALPGVGPATAAAIISHRERNGPFVVVEGLLDVRGIGEAKLAALRELVRV